VTDLKRLRPGAPLHDSLLVVEVDQRSFGEGKDCVILTLSNATGRIASAPFWSERRAAVAGLVRGDPVEITGEIRLYRGRRQLEVITIRPLSRGEVDWRRLLPSVKAIAPYWHAIDGWRREIRAPRLRSLIALFYDDPQFRGRYGSCPASTLGHHAELGGLLRHTWEVGSIGRGIAETCGADLDLVTAGVLLHDIGKLEAYAWDTGFTVTEAGALLGHVALGMLMLARRTAGRVPLRERELYLVQHLIASHHGRLEFGAAVPPMTLEAEVLHYADDASAKCASMAEAVGDADNFQGDELVSARSLWQLDRRKAYRGRSDWGLESCSSPK
jgi:3'-5' exoribonuclease